MIVERNSVGVDIDISCYEDFGQVIQYPVTTQENAAERFKDADIIIANKVPLNESTLKDATNVKLICEFSTGYDNVDIAYCKERGIKVTNVVNYSTHAVAQHTFTLALNLLEHISFYDNYVKSGIYANQPRFSNFDMPYRELAGKTWGIVGMGNIGKRVAGIAEAFGCKVIFYSASGHNNFSEYEQVDFEELLSRSDFLSLHCPLTDRTRNLINLKALQKMKKTAILINVSRGPVVNDEDLYTALTTGMIGAAGLDVLGKEPITTDNPLGRIKDSNQLIITPHMAWASTEARQRVVQEVYENIKAFKAGNDRNVIV